MDSIRSNVLQRGGPSNAREQDLEQQRLSEVGVDKGQAQTRTRHFPLSTPQLPAVFSSSGTGQRLQSRNKGDSETISPKKPTFHLGQASMLSTGLDLPNIPLTWARGESEPQNPRYMAGQPSNESTPQHSIQRTRTERSQAVAEPHEAHTRQGSRSSSASLGRRFRGADPAEMHLADLAETGRRRRNRRSSDRSGRSRRRSDIRGRPKRFMFCFPWIDSSRIRGLILQCFVSGIFLTLLLTTYLALSITKNMNSSEFAVLLILVILFTSIFFCHGLIWLCMLIARPLSSEEEDRRNLPQMLGPGGYAIPRRPIRVVLARDEEAAGLESGSPKLQPPAYGLWRESVRVDPNCIYWQRNYQAATLEERAAERPMTANRPPSYASDNGVDYVVEARPRSMVPQTDVPLPAHPS